MNSLLCHNDTIEMYIHFEQNPSFGSRDSMQKYNFGQNLTF